MFVGSSHLHAGGQAGVAAPQGKDLGSHQVLQLVLHLVAWQDLLPGPLVEDLSHHQPCQARLPLASNILPEIALQVSQFYGVFLAATHPHLSVLKLSRESLEELRITLEKALLKVMIVAHEIATNSFGHIHILFELMIKILLRLHLDQFFFTRFLFFRFLSGVFCWFIPLLTLPAHCAYFRILSIPEYPLSIAWFRIVFRLIIELKDRVYVLEVK